LLKEFDLEVLDLLVLLADLVERVLQPPLDRRRILVSVVAAEGGT
jgi:hypothetical protein